MRILVAGGAGFIGSHICRELVARGEEVICLDNLYTGRKTNISDLMPKPNFEFIRHDVCDYIDLEVDQIYNLACPASPEQYQKFPIRTIETSVLGSLNLLRLANRVKASILLTSTSEVYGDPEVHPQPESYWGNVNTVGLRSCYDESKRVAESLMYSYYLQERTEIRIARIFNTFGPHMSAGDGRVISNFINQAIRDQDITIYGDGSQTRSFCYVSDTVEALIRLMNMPEYVGPINIGNPQEHSIKEMAEIIVKLTDSKSKIAYRGLPSDDPKKRRPLITKAYQHLGWSPKVSLDDGLNQTIDHYRSLM